MRRLQARCGSRLREVKIATFLLFGVDVGLTVSVRALPSFEEQRGDKPLVEWSPTLRTPCSRPAPRK